MPKTPPQPKLSIITVVYNSKDLIENTIQSITSQTYKNIEYIVIDGASNDGTIEIIKKYKSQINFLISERDNGLYDAMNKGLANATGDYVWFINSGDLLHNNQTVEAIFRSQRTDVDIYYGETEIIDKQNQTIGLRRLKTPEHLNWKNLKDGMLVCHQSFIAKRSLVPFYNLKYRHTADFEWVLLSLKKAKEIENTHLILSKFLDGGQSKHNIISGLKERFVIMAEHFGFFPTLFRHFKIGIKFFIYLAKNKRF